MISSSLRIVSRPWHQKVSHEPSVDEFFVDGRCCSSRSSTAKSCEKWSLDFRGWSACLLIYILYCKPFKSFQLFFCEIDRARMLKWFARNKLKRPKTPNQIWQLESSHLGITSTCRSAKIRYVNLNTIHHVDTKKLACAKPPQQNQCNSSPLEKTTGSQIASPQLVWK